MTPRNRMNSLLSAAMLLASPSIGRRLDPEPREPEPRIPRPPRKLNYAERAAKREREMDRQTIRAGLQGNGLWRRNAAHGRVRGH